MDITLGFMLLAMAVAFAVEIIPSGAGGDGSADTSLGEGTPGAEADAGTRGRGDAGEADAGTRGRGDAGEADAGTRGRGDAEKEPEIEIETDAVMKSLKQSVKGLSRKDRDASAKIKALEDENRQLREASATTAGDLPKNDAGKIDPLLKGLEYDESEDQVKYKGKWFDPEVAALMRRDEIRQDRETRSERESAEAEETGSRQKRWTTFEGGIQATVDKTVGRYFPNAEGASLRLIVRQIDDAVIAGLADAGITADTDPLDLDPEETQRVVAAGNRQGVLNARALVMELQNPQILAQQKAGANEPPGPGGKAADPAAIRMAELDPSQRREAREGIARGVLNRAVTALRGSKSDRNF